MVIVSCLLLLVVIFCFLLLVLVFPAIFVFGSSSAIAGSDRFMVGSGFLSTVCISTSLLIFSVDCPSSIASSSRSLLPSITHNGLLITFLAGIFCALLLAELFYCLFLIVVLYLLLLMVVFSFLFLVVVFCLLLLVVVHVSYYLW